MSNIDLLLEKWLTAFKKYGHTLEVFENPSKKEMRGWEDRFRAIVDSKRKKIYAWPASGAIHGDAWNHIKKDINDSRPLYKSSTLIPITVDGNSVHIYGALGIPRAISNQYGYEDWSFVSRWVDLKKLQDVISRI